MQLQHVEACHIARQLTLLSVHIRQHVLQQ